MKKVLFLMLFLLVLGAAGTNAQVRIGGDGEPHTAAVLDLNTDDLITDGAKGLALPRVSLDSNDDLLGYSDLLEGMLVYNTNAGMTDGDGVGVYYWDGSQWVKSAGIYEGSTSITLSGNSFERAALIGDVTADENSNATSIADNAVTNAKIAANAVTNAKIADNAVTIGKISCASTTLTFSMSGNTAGSCGTVTLPGDCTSSNTIVNCNAAEQIVCGWSAANVVKACRFTNGTGNPAVTYLCLR